MKFIKQIAQRLNPDLHIPGTDNPPPAVLRKSKSSTTLLVTEKRKELSTPPSHSSLRKKASSMFLGRGSNIQDFANWGDTPVQSSGTPTTEATASTTSLPPPLPRTPVRAPGNAYALSPSPLSTPRPSTQNSTRTTQPSTQTSRQPSTRTSTRTSNRTTQTPTPIIPATPSLRDPAPIASSMALSVSTSDKSLPYFPLAGQAKDGFSNNEEATATCFCGAVQLAFPVEGPGLVSTFVCNCADCRKITASMFASNFTVRDSHLRHLRGRANLSSYGQASTIASGHTMTNYFCKTCGTLMYRVGAAFPDCSILRLGTVDDFNLVETKLKPTRELFVKDRVSWFEGVKGDEVKRFQAML